MSDDVTWIEEPATLVRVDDEYVVHLYDAARLDPARLERELRHARAHAPDLFMLAYRGASTLDALDLSPLFPEDGAEDGLWSMVDLIDNYMEIHRVVNARRVGARLELTAYTDRMTEGAGAFVPDEDHAHGGEVACDADALRAALEGVRERIERVVARAARVAAADADTPLEDWLAWADDPHPRVRRAVIKNARAPDAALDAMTARGEHVWELGRRRTLPPASIERIYGVGHTDLKRFMVEMPNAPRGVLMRAIEDAEGGARHDARTAIGAKARAALVGRMLEEGADLDAVFGELRSLLDSTPCEEAAEAAFAILEAAAARAPERVSQLWVPYARDHMAGWERHDCALPGKLALRWKRHRVIGPAWGIARVLGFQRHVAGTPDSAWDVFADSPHLGAIESLGVRQQVGEHALGCIARASLPSMDNLVLVNWGEAPDAPDASALADADWVPQLEHVMLGSYTFPRDALARMLTRAPRLEWLSLTDVSLDASHADALVASGAHARLRYLSVHGAEVAALLDALAGTPLPALTQISLHESDVPRERLAELAEAFPGVKVSIS